MNIAERLNLRGATQAALVPLLLIAACEQGTDLSLPAPVHRIRQAVRGQPRQHGYPELD
jgi:hypothetical protein